MTLFYALLVGVAMGALIQRVQASSPGMIVVYTLDLVVPQMLHFDIKPTYVIGVTLGGLIFGVGFAVGGYCPGTCVVGFAEGRRDAIAAILGGIVGALAFTLLYNTLLEPIIKPMDLGKVRLQDYVHIPSILLALIVGGGMLVLMKVLPTLPGKSQQ
jgi:uncharacterized membrane protein YedE/YeeE